MMILNCFCGIHPHSFFSRWNTGFFLKRGEGAWQVNVFNFTYTKLCNYTYTCCQLMLTTQIKKRKVQDLLWEFNKNVKKKKLEKCCEHKNHILTFDQFKSVENISNNYYNCYIKSPLFI